LFTYNVLLVGNADDEIKRSISAVNNFILAVFEERTLVSSSAEALPDEFSF